MQLVIRLLVLLVLLEASGVANVGVSMMGTGYVRNVISSMLQIHSIEAIIPDLAAGQREGYNTRINASCWTKLLDWGFVRLAGVLKA